MGRGNNHNPCEAGKGGLSVRVDEGKFERAMKIFKKKVMNDGILKQNALNKRFDN